MNMNSLMPALLKIRTIPITKLNIDHKINMVCFETNQKTLQVSYTSIWFQQSCPWEHVSTLLLPGIHVPPKFELDKISSFFSLSTSPRWFVPFLPCFSFFPSPVGVAWLILNPLTLVLPAPYAAGPMLLCETSSPWLLTPTSRTLSLAG